MYDVLIINQTYQYSSKEKFFMLNMILPNTEHKKQGFITNSAPWTCAFEVCWMNLNHSQILDYNNHVSSIKETSYYTLPTVIKWILLSNITLQKFVNKTIVHKKSQFNSSSHQSFSSTQQIFCPLLSSTIYSTLFPADRF